MLLSEKGRAFLSYANDMVQLEAEAIETVSENTTPTGTLRIGTIESIASSFLPLLLEEYLKKCPQVHLDIIIGVTLELYDQLEKGNLDIIFLADRPAYHPTLKTVFSRPVAVPFIASAEHPLANQKNVPPERLTEETILLTEKNNNYRQIFDELAIQHRCILSSYAGDFQLCHHSAFPAKKDGHLLPAQICNPTYPARKKSRSLYRRRL